MFTTWKVLHLYHFANHSMCDWLKTINQHQINLIEIVPTAVKPVNESISIYSFFSGNHLARTRVATAQRIRSKCPIYRVDKKRKPHWFMNNLINFQSSLTPLSGCQAKILSSVVPEHEVTSPIGSWDTVICVWRCILENIKSKRESQTSFQRFFTQTFLNWKRFEAMAWYLATLIISVLWRVLENFIWQSYQVRNLFNFGPR